MKSFIKHFFVLAGLIVMVKAETAELNGSWTSTTPGGGIVGTWTVNFVQNSQKIIEGYTTSLSTNLQQEYGFNIGDKLIYGTFDGTTYKGKILLHYPVSYKHCSNWSIWGDFTLTLASDGNILSGNRAEVGTINDDCSINYTNETISLIISKNVENIASCSNSSSATIASNLNIHIPNATYQDLFGGTMNIWADLQLVPSTDGTLMWKLSNSGLNQ